MLLFAQFLPIPMETCRAEDESLCSSVSIPIQSHFCAVCFSVLDIAESWLLIEVGTIMFLIKRMETCWANKGDKDSKQGVIFTGKEVIC